MSYEVYCDNLNVTDCKLAVHFIKMVKMLVKILKIN